MSASNKDDRDTDRTAAAFWLRVAAIGELIVTSIVVAIGLHRDSGSEDMTYAWALVAVINFLYARLLWRRASGKPASFLGQYSFPPDGNEHSAVTDRSALVFGVIFTLGTIALLWH